MYITTFYHFTRPCDPHIPERVGAAITRWCKISGEVKSPLQATLVITDNVEFANDAKETNDIVILISDTEETITRGIIVVSCLEIEDALYSALSA